MSDILNSSIILVDDSSFARAMMSSILTEIGFKNITCPETPIEAWELIAQSHLDGNPYDLLITDLNMPGFDGIDLINRIKEDPMSENQKIVVMSADADMGIKMVCKAMGVLAYFTKPIKSESLKEILFAIFEGKEEIPDVEDLI